MNLLNELKHRSNQRKKIIQQKQTALLTSKMKRSQEQCPNKINTLSDTTTSKTNVEVKENKENMKPPPNVVILQNETINADNTATLKKKQPLKRPSKGKFYSIIQIRGKRFKINVLIKLDPDSASKLKKTKKVSFGNCYSQEDQISNNTITSDSQNKNEVSSYFSKIDNVNMFEPQPSFLRKY